MPPLSEHPRPRPATSIRPAAPTRPAAPARPTSFSRSAFLRASASALVVPTLAAPAAHAAGPDLATASTGPTPTGHGHGGDPLEDGLVHGSHSLPGNDGRAHEVTWDARSFRIDGERLHLYAGEIHPWRVPAPAQWRELLQLMRATGFNAVSFYFFWGLHQTEEGGPFDFTGIKDVDLLLRIAEQEGLYVIARPGPYVNAEISMGGLPAYLTNRKASLRSTDPDNLADSKAWLSAIGEILTKHQVTEGGGSVLMWQIENELISEEAQRSEFLRTLAQHVRSIGASVPLFHNDYNLGGRFQDAEVHDLDFYAYDHYPLGFDAGGDRQRLGEAEAQFREFAPESPHFITESQGGAFTPWGAPFDASQAYEFTDPAFTRQWGVRNLGNGVTAFNYYMAFGGTNWGYTGSPSSGFTSYDYGAGITEDRLVTGKLAVQKELAAFQDALPQITSMAPASAPLLRDVDGADVQAYQRIATDDEKAASDDGASRLLAFRLADSNDETDTRFAVRLLLGAKDTGGGAGQGDGGTGLGGDAGQGGDAGPGGGGAAQGDARGSSSAEEPDVDDGDAAIQYEGDWESTPDETAFGGTVHRTETAGATASWTFTGTGVDVITATGTDHGTAECLIDGEVEGTFTSHVASDQNKPTRFVAHRVRDLEHGEHTVTVRATGKAAEGGTGTVVTLDAFDVPGDAEQDPDAPIPDGVTGWVRVPQKQDTALHLHGRDAFVVTADCLIGGHALLYSTSQLFGPALPRRGGMQQILVGADGDPGEIVLRYDREPRIDAPRRGVESSWDETSGQLRLNVTHGEEPVEISLRGRPLGADGTGRRSTLHLRFLSRTAAARTWILSGTPGRWVEPTPGHEEAHVVVEGAEHARAVTFDGSTARITAGGAERTSLRVDVPEGVRRVEVDGHRASVHEGVAQVHLRAPWKLDVPALRFRGIDEAPETAGDLDESGWTHADSTTGSTDQQGPGRGGIVLDSNHYGMFEGSVWYRAHFTATAKRSLTLRANGGTGQPATGKAPAFAQAWAGGKSLGAFPADGQDHELAIPAGARTTGKEAVLAVLVHNLGQNLDWSDDGLSKQTRGLYDAVLPADGDVRWLIRGVADPAGADDPLRTMYNVGGLHGEREGWHLPEFADHRWKRATSMVADEPGIRWYRADFRLRVPEQQDASWRLVVRSSRFERDRSDHSQVVLYVNGWQIGIYIGDIGPQSEFTIPAGILDPSGRNQLALWVAAKEKGAGPDHVELKLVGNRTGGIGHADPLV
ncbi:beta-galactosidase [Brachybacterium endophyticum]|uniref:beta-galactosidase n=1 Tax=Brachybacterium endophyticum TaxID=2182385 RepID=A0A2U2RK66_9MICO|nr:beta-galactosidase [Brachybacterium endophyticum]PWH06174.1 beta-galactosidase [Brachybacterium endophyticum]